MLYLFCDVHDLHRRMLELSLLETFVPGSESSIGWNFRSRERKFPGAKVPWNFFVPWNFRSWERKSESLSSETNGQNFGSCRRCKVLERRLDVIGAAANVYTGLRETDSDVE